MIKKKLLVVATRPIFPIIAGDALRLYEVCRYLSSYFEVSLVCFGDTKNVQKPDFISELIVVKHSRVEGFVNIFLGLLFFRPLQVSWYTSRKLSKLVRDIDSEFDYFLGHLVRTVPYLKHVSHKTVIEITDYLPLTYERATKHGRLMVRVLFFFEGRLLKRFHRKALSNFRTLSVVSQVDARLLSLEAGRANVVTFENGCSVYEGPLRSPENSVMFIGNLRTIQNQDAVSYFISEVLPLVRAERSDVDFLIVGSVPEQFKSKWQASDIKFIGFLEKFCDMPRGVGVCPMRIGAGIQNKILDYINYGLPVVSTPEGLEGLQFEDGADLYTAYSAGQMATYILELLNDNQQFLTMSENAKSKLVRTYRWQQKLSGLESQFEKMWSR